MDYSQFLYMHEELSLLAVILILFIADLFMCPDKKSGKGVYNTCLPVVLLTLHTVLNFLPCADSVSCEAFGSALTASDSTNFATSKMSSPVSTSLPTEATDV